MVNTDGKSRDVRIELTNRTLFRLYQCANMMHKTGTKAVESEGLTTQQWAVLGALSREHVVDGMSIGDLARFLMVSRQNLAGVIQRMERDGHICVAPDGRDRRSRLIRMTEHGHRTWFERTLPKIHDYYEHAMADFSTADIAHMLHYLLKLLENLKRLDGDDDADGAAKD